MNLKLFSKRFRDNLFLISMFFIFIVSAQAQKKVSGTVTSNGLPLPGANVVEKGSSAGTSTDIDGKFTFNVSSNATTLVVSFLGYTTKEVAITEGPINVSLSEESNTLEEVVINVGYGTQKKSVTTGAISKVSAKDLEKVPNGRVEQSLQGRVSGVTIASNSGAPGSASTIRVRGITTFGGANNPLWVIDGVVVDSGALGYLNQSDIESIEVLKDAASAAIYGTRAASGVVLITTKKGKKGKISVNYNGFTGISSPEKTLSVLNATEYGAIMNEKSVAAGGNLVFPDLSVLGVGTDWQKEVFNSGAQRYNHELSFSGGSENSNFYVSFGMQDQEGIVATEVSNYNKKNFRLNSNHKISEIFSIGQSFGYTHQKQVGIGSLNTEFGGVLSSAIMLDPTTPLIVTDPIVANSAPYNNFNNPTSSTYYVVRDENGNPYGISSFVGQEIANPVAFSKIQRGNFGWSDDFVGNFFIEANIMKGLKFKSSAGGKKSYWGNEFFSPKFYLNASFNNGNKSSLTRNTNTALDWIIDNVLTYTREIGDHNFTVLLGQEVNVLGASGYYSGVTHANLPTNDYQDASFNYEVPAADKTGYSSDMIEHRLTSIFARLNYDYKEKYLFTGIIRRDGSSRFGPDNKYGTFPSMSLGWVVSKEGFWKDNSVVNTLKIRGGYGVNGNVGPLSDFMYLSLVDGGSNYTFGGANQIGTGYAPVTIDNPELHWEETAQTNFGFDAKLFNDVTLTMEYYKKETTDIIQRLRIPGYVGVNQNPFANVASMENSGLEVELGYRKKIGGVNFSATGVFSTLKNEVTNIGAGVDFITDDAAGFQSMGGITRTQVGEAYNSFYGFQTAGIFQNQAEVNAYTNASGGLIQPNAVPGDFRWVDVNGDGTINNSDKTFLGSPLPKYTFGLTLNADYKGFDVMVFAQGAAGNKIFQGLRRLDVGNANYQTEALSRWHGEGTSNDYPRLTNNDTNGNFGNMSDFYLEKGDYLRLKVVQLGYSLPTTMVNKIGANKVRLYVTGENLLTLTKYTGYDPEIGGTVLGIDKGFYPQARTLMFGANLQF
jgi:TonB-dependent starch-binding outer membrane protein SusC